ncbi:DUF262 domain-containing protein [Neobacillus sp. KR4-4]|uniref:DUF262 domain-containing protein n=1 Tax=Neobacillus sp. KR4-4 TaxID=3344872 RepID=UPI0035CAEB6B
MSYLSVSIKDIVAKISNNEVYLPAIQRKFVWKHEQIEKLFDSIMLGYPIGTFLFWDVEKSLANSYTFYKFIQEYHERDNFMNEKAPHPEMKDRIIGILDGQQRLSSLYLALQGSHASKKPRARWDNDDAFPKKYMYFNILCKNQPRNDENITYEFKFLTDAEAGVSDSDHCWLKVKEALTWRDANDSIRYATGKQLLTNEVAIENLTTLWQRITQDKIINYFQVIDQDLDSVLEIFIRVNSGGTVLSKSDLLFSTIVANWENAREEIEALIKSINNRGEKFDFDNDFIMRSCLVLTDCPVLFNVNNFKKGNVIKIKENWEKIKSAIKETVDLLVEFGFNQDTLTSRNAIIPISYFIFKGGLLDGKNKSNIRKYLIISLLKQIYGGKGDQVLDSIRNVLRKQDGNGYILKTPDFPLQTLQKHRLPAEKSLNLTDEDIDNIFEYKKGAYTFMVLSLLYPSLKFSQVQFHQDHIHPASTFKNSNLKKLGISKDEIENWQRIKDTISNLQILEGRENESKSKTPFNEWYENSVSNKPLFKSNHYIPETNYKLSNFDEFIKLRSEKLKLEIKRVFNMTIHQMTQS